MIYRFLRYINRMIRPFLNVRDLIKALGGTPRFIYELFRYRAMSREKVPMIEVFPIMNEYNSKAASLDPHYFQQDLYVARKIVGLRPTFHVDIGSRVDGFVALLTLSLPVEFVDLRPLSISIPNLHYKQGNLYSLPYPDKSLLSLSSLHVVEHVGLGRYGDKLDPAGPVKAMKELQRVVAPGGKLYISVPVGRPRVCFNAHRVFAPDYVIKQLDELILINFAGVNDDGKLFDNIHPNTLSGSEYALGIYEFSR